MSTYPQISAITLREYSVISDRTDGQCHSFPVTGRKRLFWIKPHKQQNLNIFPLFSSVQFYEALWFHLPVFEFEHVGAGSRLVFILQTLSVHLFAHSYMKRDLLLTNLVIPWLQQLSGCLCFGLSIAVNIFTLLRLVGNTERQFITAASSLFHAAQVRPLKQSDRITVMTQVYMCHMTIVCAVQWTQYLLGTGCLCTRSARLGFHRLWFGCTAAVCEVGTYYWWYIK